jgi:hypothetical protein
MHRKNRVRPSIRYHHTAAGRTATQGLRFSFERRRKSVMAAAKPASC